MIMRNEKKILEELLDRYSDDIKLFEGVAPIVDRMWEQAEDYPLELFVLEKAMLATGERNWNDPEEEAAHLIAAGIIASTRGDYNLDNVISIDGNVLKLELSDDNFFITVHMNPYKLDVNYNGERFYGYEGLGSLGSEYDELWEFMNPDIAEDIDEVLSKGIN